MNQSVQYSDVRPRHAPSAMHPRAAPVGVDTTAPFAKAYAGRPRRAPPAPLQQRLAVVTSYFNPCNYRSLRRNYLRFAADMRRQRVPLFTVELAFRDQPFMLRSGSRQVQVRATDVMWQKERLLNLLIERLPDSFDQVAWIDADVRFDTDWWLVDASRVLEEKPVVQLFQHAELLDARDEVAQVRPGVAYAVANRLPQATHFGHAHPGFAWAARRDVLARHGLLDHHIAGGGDSLMVIAMYGWWNHPTLRCYSPAMLDAYFAWAEPFFAQVWGSVGSVPGRLRHFWHGSRNDRQYVERNHWLLEHHFDPRSDLALNDSGTWSWRSDKMALQEQIEQYFYARREDQSATM